MYTTLRLHLYYSHQNITIYKEEIRPHIDDYVNNYYVIVMRTGYLPELVLTSYYRRLITSTPIIIITAIITTPLVLCMITRSKPMCNYTVMCFGPLIRWINIARNSNGNSNNFGNKDVKARPPYKIRDFSRRPPNSAFTLTIGSVFTTCKVTA